MMGCSTQFKKAFYLGVDDTNMLSFSPKTSSILKMVNKDGLQAARALPHQRHDGSDGDERGVGR